MNWNESEIQGLKAQEAKDLAVELLHKLEAKEKGMITPGEVQLKELDFQLRLREAENEDHRRREEHEQRIKDLELQIEAEKTRCAEAERQANRVRESHALVIDRVTEAGESLSTQLERANRENNLKIEQLESDFATRQEKLARTIEEQELQRDSLRGEIDALTDLQSAALEVGELQDKIERRRKESVQTHAEMEERVAAAEFEKVKRIGDVKREQDLELARLSAQHEKDVLHQNQQAVESILEGLEMIAVNKTDWASLQESVREAQTRTENEVAQIREQARDDLRSEFNITRNEPVDVTDLFYREQAAQSEIDRLRSQVDKLETEVLRMRQHIEKEPQRIASAVEAARTQVQNYIEQAGKR